MTNLWILRLINQEKKEAEWGFWGESGTFEKGPFKGNLSNAAKDFSEDDDVLVLVPGMDVSILTEVVPAKQRSQVIKVIPYAMEEQVATDVDSLHFALGEKGRDGSFLVAVIAHHKMQAWLDYFMQSGLMITHMLPETLAVPYEQNIWTFIKEGNVFLVRTNDTAAFAFEEEHLADFLKLEMESTETNRRPKKMVLWNTDDKTKQFIQQLFETVEVEDKKANNTILETFARGIGDIPFVNLIQQQYQPKESVKQIVRYWLPVGVVAAAILIVQFGYKLYEVNALDSANDRLHTEIHSLYKKTFPKDRRVINPKAQLKSHLEELKKSGGGNQFLPLFAAASAKLSQDPDVRLLSFRYSENKGSLELELETQDFQRFESVRQSLAEDLEVKVRTSNISQNNLVQGSLQVSQK